MKSASMPFTGPSRTVEKSSSTEFKFKIPLESRQLAGNDRKPTYVISAATSSHSPSRGNTQAAASCYPFSTNNNPIFYKPATTTTTSTITNTPTANRTNTTSPSNSLPLSNTNSSNNTHHSCNYSGSHNNSSGSHSVYLLPDIGAPDVTYELYSGDERRPSAESTASHLQQQWGSNSELSTCNEPSSSPRTTKTVFYTHSMKKKSTEPKFV